MCAVISPEGEVGGVFPLVATVVVVLVVCAVVIFGGTTTTQIGMIVKFHRHHRHAVRFRRKQ